MGNRDVIDGGASTWTNCRKPTQPHEKKTISFFESRRAKGSHPSMCPWASRVGYFLSLIRCHRSGVAVAYLLQVEVDIIRTKTPPLTTTSKRTSPEGAHLLPHPLGVDIYIEREREPCNVSSVASEVSDAYKQ